MFSQTPLPGFVPVHAANSEESLVADERDATRPAARVEQRVFDQLGRAALGVSAYRMQDCSRGRRLT